MVRLLKLRPLYCQHHPIPIPIPIPISIPASIPIPIPIPIPITPSRSCSDICSDDREALAKLLGISAVKYADLSRSRTSNYAFSFDEMLDLRGNTSVYLQYANCRINSILRRLSDAQSSLSPSPSPSPSPLSHATARLSLQSDAERDLALVLLRYEDVLKNVSTQLLPHLLCSYMFELATAINTLYHQQHIIGHQRQHELIELLTIAQRVLQHSFRCIGVVPVQRM